MRETEEKRNNEDGTEKADAIEHRIKDKCDERADEWADDVLVSHADARYHTDCYVPFFSGRSLPSNTSKEILGSVKIRPD